MLASRMLAARYETRLKVRVFMGLGPIPVLASSAIQGWIGKCSGLWAAASQVFALQPLRPCSICETYSVVVS